MFYAGGKKRDNIDTFKNYRKLISSLTLEAEDYSQLRRAFAGGFTHANVLYSREIVENVSSKDFTSSYPYVMVSEKFPMSPPKKITIKDDIHFRQMLNNYCCVFDLSIYGLEPQVVYENYISSSHCYEKINIIQNNGRIVSADKVSLTVTEQDFFIIEKFYKWDKMEIFNFKIMRKGYLPKNFIKTILDLYELKTTLKDVEDRKLDYLLSKERINSMYGMCVTDICRDKIIYSPTDWTAERPNGFEAIEKNNKSVKRFLYYPWGVWVTAYARFNLFTAIVELGDDYVYCDTDSVKYINPEKHEKYFNQYNQAVRYKLMQAMKYHDFDIERTRPKNIKNEEKELGVWDDEGVYTRFKTLGAKRYMTEKYNKNGELEISITVSGLNKDKAVPYLLEEYGDKIFEVFDDELYIKPDKTGKMTHTYLDEPFSGVMTDYQGNKAEYHELSAIHLENADYSLSISDLYIKYMLSIEDDTE